MRGLNGCVLLFVIIILQNVIDSMSFGILKAFLSPPMPRVKRIKNGSPRVIREIDPYAVSDFMGLVKQHNYPAEEHNVTTIDGYNLIVHRIPHSPISPQAKRKPIVLIMHGLLASSDSWVLIGPGKDLAFLLADAGFDVWLGNFRGNTYSRSHTVLSPDDPTFWQHSFHEMAYYDLPATIDYILDQTGQKNLTYVGHSMGTLCSYIFLSERPEYNQRIRLLISLAPVAYWKHRLFGYQKLAVENGELIQATLRTGRINELLPQSSLNSKLAAALCGDTSVTRTACINTFFSVVGFDHRQFNASLIPYISSYLPAGVSLKTIEHFYQSMRTGEFKQYDYGYAGNFAHYKQKNAPAYDITNVTVPTALFYGLGDGIILEEDVYELKNRLPNVIKFAPVSYKPFNHIDFLWANDVKNLLYDDIIELIKKFH